MHFTQATDAPNLKEQDTPAGGRLVVTDVFDAGADMPDDPVTAYRLALTRAAGAVMAQGAMPPHLSRMVLWLPDIGVLQDRLIDYDLAFRETLAGNFPAITVVEDRDLTGPKIALSAVVPPAGDPDAKVYGDFTQAEINFQYSPRAQAPDHDKYFELWRLSGPAYQKNRVAEVWFGETPGQSFDLFLPDGVENPPLHLFIHGGYWQALDKRNHAHMADAMLKAGIAVAMVNYDLMPDVDLSEILRQCRAAVARAYDVAADYGYDRDRLTVSGHSAGGHLSGALACTDWADFRDDLPADLLKGAVPISGLFDLEPLSKTGMQPVFRFTADDIAGLSPINMKPVTAIPVVLSVGSLESPEFHRQSALFADHMRAHGCPVSEAVMEGHHHFSIVEALTDPAVPLTAAIIDLAKNS
ncbi:alpha/beta hydrolase [Hwanghaeella grinnelliae]|uniref:Alpha/beta hydrolase n=1 Tax=Hwanghaeella grinnelliae TaxID=2500179 RepID=A0A437QJV9_9PROT|nr:alpha/beta hydrolase [Hwanghaeella grinnelliae]RVU34801.1 alpha/beta hydrolase [Hwanghaeella grinnelliae]